MTDKAEFVEPNAVQPVLIADPPLQDDLLRMAWARSNLSTGQIAEAYRCIVSAAIELKQYATGPKFEAGDAVEVAVVAFDSCYGEGTKQEAMTHALQAAFPALVARAGELEELVGACWKAAREEREPHESDDELPGIIRTERAGCDNWRSKYEAAMAEVERLKGAK